jgi:hypothetical protein
LKRCIESLKTKWDILAEFLQEESGMNMKRCNTCLKCQAEINDLVLGSKSNFELLKGWLDENKRGTEEMILEGYKIINKEVRGIKKSLDIMGK